HARHEVRREWFRQMRGPGTVLRTPSEGFAAQNEPLPRGRECLRHAAMEGLVALVLVEGNPDITRRPIEALNAPRDSARLVIDRRPEVPGPGSLVFHRSTTLECGLPCELGRDTELHCPSLETVVEDR